MAAGLARDLARQGTAPAGLILESTFTSLGDMGAAHYPWLPVRLLARFRYDARQDLAGLSLPILFLHSPEDEIVPYALGRALYRDYGGPKTFLALRGGHNDGFLTTGPDYAQGLRRFLDGLFGEDRE